MEVKEKREGGRALLVFCIISVLVILLASYVSAAADVAYLYKRVNNIDDNILDVFNDAGLTVETISDTQIPTKLSAANLNNYKIIFVGDERFRNVARIPVDKKPTIIANYYHGLIFGLTDYDGISKLASNAPLSVRKNSQIIQVYTQAKYNGKTISIPYYYLDDENKADGMEKAAGTYTGNAYDFGDVISYADEGTHLQNGKTALGKICFFGIIESDYWTPAAEDMFEDCLGFVAMECASDLDCADEEIGNPYCLGDDVFQDIQQFHCENPGKVNSQCVDDIIPQLVEDCNDGNNYTEDVCSNGQCQHNPLECIQASDCGEDDWINEPLCVGNNVHQDYQTFSCINNICSNQTNQMLNETCSEGCFNGACAEITCYNNAECGTPGYIGDEFCQGDDVYRNYQAFNCNNPGTINSSCSSNSTPQLVEQCSGTCQAGECVDITCSIDADCNDNDSWTKDKCNLPGTPASYCTNEPIVCFSNSDCGINGYTGAAYCISDNIFRNFQSHICFNAGTASSYCASNATQILNTICPDSCYLGGCVDITCNTNADCDDGSAYTEDICLLPGTVLSSCTHGDITCIQDSDCGADMFIGDTYCTGNDIFRDFKAYDCKNPGLTSSYCSSNTTGNFLESCTYPTVCANGDCVRCNDNSDCDDGNNYTYDICRFSGTPESYCSHEHIECSQDSECGTDGFVDLPFCQGDDLYQSFRTFDCKNEGTPGSYCDDDSTPSLIEECEFGCAGSECLPGIHDVALIDFTNSFGRIRLEEPDGTDILGNPAQLICNQDYKIVITAENQGNFFENVTFNGSIDGLLFSHNSIPDFAPADTSLKTKTVNFNLLAGLYNIIINAIIPQDDDLSDNQATRQVEIICPDCFTDPDCPDDITGDNYCIGDDVYHDITGFECIGGDCMHNTNPELIEECAFECVGGECQECEEHTIDYADINTPVVTITKSMSGGLSGDNSYINDNNYINYLGIGEAEHYGGWVNLTVVYTFASPVSFDNIIYKRSFNTWGSSSDTETQREKISVWNASGQRVVYNRDITTGGDLLIIDAVNNTITDSFNEITKIEMNFYAKSSGGSSDRFTRVRLYEIDFLSSTSCGDAEEPECEPEVLIQNYPHLDDEMEIDIDNEGYLIFKNSENEGDVEDVMRVILQKAGGGSQVIYCFDREEDCPVGCRDVDDVCVLDRGGNFLYQHNYEWGHGSIPDTKVDVKAGDNLIVEEEWFGYFGLEIWQENECPD